MNKIKKIVNLETAEFRAYCSILHRRKILFLLLFIFCFCLTLPIFAQDEQTQITAPPPLKTISKLDKDRLSAESNLKDRTKMALEMMTARLTSAETYNSQSQYVQMFDELGGFHALVDDTLDNLAKYDNESGKVLNNFKRLEMSLRTFAPRLELIRRDLPIRYELYVRKLIIYLRQARTKAVKPLFENSIVSETEIKIPDENQ